MTTYEPYPGDPRVLVDTSVYEPDYSSLTPLSIRLIQLSLIDVTHAHVGDYVHGTLKRPKRHLVFKVVERAWEDGVLRIWITTRPGRVS